MPGEKVMPAGEIRQVQNHQMLQLDVFDRLLCGRALCFYPGLQEAVILRFSPMHLTESEKLLNLFKSRTVNSGLCF